ncbi:MAG: myo-inositol 2-dehydrogenase / D-chiro-inositol 1-dehydrogenase, partial [Acidobacteriaceae bacterium]|nr:myo-inositol 2-dehydrogenase / D-chiro-inositol 1-dehydrogenase [Acidobacteriaceae bacterium]
MTGKKLLNIGIIGAGRIGRVHADTLSFRVPQAIPAAIADIKRSTAQDVAVRCGIAHVALDADEILS